jgi:hypothetical protein
MLGHTGIASRCGLAPVMRAFVKARFQFNVHLHPPLFTAQAGPLGPA